MATNYILIREIKTGEMHVLSLNEYSKRILRHEGLTPVLFEPSDYEKVMEGTMKEISDYLNPEDRQE